MTLDIRTIAAIIILGCLIVITIAVGHLAWGWL
jgi:hypothetical protein